MDDVRDDDTDDDACESAVLSCDESGDGCVDSEANSDVVKKNMPPEPTVVRELKAKNSNRTDIRNHFLKKQSEPDSEPAKKRTRGLGKKTLEVQSSATNLTTIPATSVFHTFVLTTTQDKERDKRLERAPLADNARDRAVPVAIHPQANHGRSAGNGLPTDTSNTNKYSVYDFLKKTVDCYRQKQHKDPHHKCKKGQTYAECGVYVEDGKLMCCGKSRKAHRGTMNTHVHTKSHDKFQVWKYGDHF